MINDVFYSELHIKTGVDVIVVDARTSDAVALAVRSDSPIYIKSEILDIVGTAVESETTDTEDEDEIDVDAEELTTDELDLLALEDLEELLNMAVKEEKYELAVNVRDAIKRKDKKE